MYELTGNQLLMVEVVETQAQTAIVKSFKEIVIGYDKEYPITFEYIPERLEEGEWDLHYEGGELVWKEVIVE